MLPVSLEQLDLLTREELLALLKALLPEFELLRQRVANLEAENERLKQQLTGSTNSRNSSQPPSRDQKPNLPPGKANRQSKEKARSAVRASEIFAPAYLPEVRPLVIETRQHQVTCNGCWIAARQNCGRSPHRSCFARRSICATGSTPAK